MDENPAALECLICFYINTKYFLKARLLDEKMFMYQMVKHCRDQGFRGYNDKEIKNTWKKLVSKYASLKTKGSTQDRESWKYFEIFDSCYEELDFQDEVQSKFSQEMVWFLIGSFLKRKRLGRTQKSNGLLKDILKEFSLSGYHNVTKHDIENTWKYLNLKYEKLKDDPEGLKKFPYLQALRVFHGESKTQLVNMVFTKNLTEMLVECFTKKKISCVIHGYDSDKVLNEIQMKFTELGFYFSKDAIIEKWRNLTTTYKFLLTKKEKTAWIYFNAMRNHFTDDYLLLCKGSDKEEICKEEGSKPRRLRQRSKSVGAQLRKTDFDEPGFTVKLPLPDIIISEDNSRNKSVKRPFEDEERSDSPRKRGRPRKSLQKADDGDVQITKSKLDLECSEFNQKVLDESKSEGEQEKLPENHKKSPKRLKLTDDAGKISKTGSSPNKSVADGHRPDDSIKDNAQSTYFRDPSMQQNQNITSNLTSEAQTLDVVDSNLNKKDEKTIDVPLIAKHLDNELLPFKKRLIIDMVKIDKYITDSNEAKEGAIKFPVTEFENQPSQNDRKTTEQVETDRSTCETNDKLDKFGPKTFKTYQRFHKKQQNQIESESVCPMPNVNDVTQNSFLSSGRNINRTNNNGNLEEVIDLTNDSCQDTFDSVSNTQEVETCTDVAPANRELEENNLSDVNATDIETSVVYNNISEIVDVCTSNLYPNDTEQVTELADSGVHDMNTESDDVETEQHYGDNVSESQEPLVVFRKPLPVAKGTTNQAKWCPETSDKSQTSTKLPCGKNQILISRKRLNNLTKLKFDSFLKSSGNSANVTVKQTFPGFKYISQIIKHATGVTDSKQDEPRENRCNDDSSLAASETEPLPSGNGNEKNDEFENESVFSEAVGDDGLKDNLLATVIDFQEQNNQEFIEIKNLMKQNNLLQRETNRLLRLLLEKM